MHLDKDRAGYEEVKNEVVSLARDVLALWAIFSTKPGLEAYAGLLKERRLLAMDEARKVAKQYEKHGYESPFA